MSFPDGLATVLLTYAGTNPAGGGAATGTVKLQPNVPAVTVEGYGQVFAGSGTYRFANGVLVDADGNPGVPILPNDVPGTRPKGWLWLAIEKIDGAPTRSYYFRVSADQQEADLASIQEIDPGRPDYVPVVGAAGRDGQDGRDGRDGRDGDDGADGTDGTDGQSAYQLALADGFTGTQGQWLASLTGPPGADGSNADAQEYTDTALSGEVTRADAAYAAADDARLTDARAPLPHATSHGAAGDDPITPAAIGAYTAAAGATLAGRVTGTETRVAGVETRTSALESGKADLVGGLIPTAQLPAIAIGDTTVVASQAAMLALDAQRGDMAVRTDTNPARTYVLAADNPTVLANWIRVSFGDLASVNGQTGVVVLAAADVGAETPSGATTKANAAQAAAIAAAATDATTKANNAQTAAAAAASTDATTKANAAQAAAVAAAATDASTKADSAQSAAISAAAADATTKANNAQAAAISAAAADATTKSGAAQTAAVSAAATAAAAAYTPQSITTVAASITPNPFYVWHRGGGGENPEHTDVAYANAYASGAAGMEVSVHISADGVLFCMHDNDLIRITNSTWTTNPELWTYAALLQRAKVVSTPLLGPGWADQPIPRLKDVLDKYLGKIVLWIEAKTSGSTVPLQNLLTAYFAKYPQTKSTVVWKGYYTNSSLNWAKNTMGLPVWAYVDAVPVPTTQAQMDTVDANVTYWGVPWEAADAQISACVARGKPVMVWEVHRRSEVTRLTGLGVKGIMTPQPAYLTHSTATPIVTYDTFPTQIKAPGDIGAAHSDATFAMKWDTALDSGAIYLNKVGGEGLLLGSRSCMVDGATGYRISFDMLWPALPVGTLHAGLYFGQADDAKHTFAAANASPCYRMLIRPNAGTLQLYTVAAGSTSGVQVGGSGTGDLATSAFSAGTWYSFQIDVTAASVTLRRTDSTGWARTFADTSFRGRYFGLQNGSLTDLATVPRYRGLLPTPI